MGVPLSTCVYSPANLPDEILQPMSPKSSTRRESADASQQPSITIGDLLRAVFLPPQDAPAADQPRITLNWPWQSPLPFAVTDTIASELNAPTHIEYAPSATPKVEATPTRMTLLGLGDRKSV